ncbi:MAG: PorT family protein [Candidatus Aminicenantes bacterium]|nr:PorT family protein [Candidatus Aminicenantes bacterium]
MKKVWSIILVVAILILLFPMVSEAGIQLGFRAGVNSAKFIGSDVNWLEEMEGLTSGKYGLVGGLFLAINLGKSLTIEPEFLYTMKGTNIDDPLGEYSGKLFADYLEIPVLLKLRLSLPIVQPVIFAGPSVGFKLREKLQVDGQDIPLEEKIFQNNDYGAIFGAGLDFGQHLMIDVRYSLGLKKVFEVAEGYTTPDVKNGVWSATVGIAF